MSLAVASRRAQTRHTHATLGEASTCGPHGWAPVVPPRPLGSHVPPTCRVKHAYCLLPNRWLGEGASVTAAADASHVVVEAGVAAASVCRRCRPRALAPLPLAN